VIRSESYFPERTEKRGFGRGKGQTSELQEKSGSCGGGARMIATLRDEHCHNCWLRGDLQSLLRKNERCVNRFTVIVKSQPSGGEIGNKGVLN